MPSLFRLASYNILADAYIKPERYPTTDPDVLAPKRRWAALGERIAALDADIVCLQEVEPALFRFLEARLTGEGYTGLYAPKGQGKPDGCATLFRATRLPLVESTALHYTDGTPPSGHLAQISRFTTERGIVRIANTHLKWDSSRSTESHIGHRQIVELLAVLDTTAPGTVATILCGDLNVTPTSAIVAQIQASGFMDAYRAYPQPTCNAHARAKRLDFLFHTENLSAVPDPLPTIDDHTPLPSATEPSDHLPIIARVEEI